MLMKHTLSALVFAAASLAAQNQSASFTNGIDGYLEIPYAAQIVPKAGVTLEAWITYDDTTLPSGWRYPTIFRQNQNAGTEAFFLRIEANNVGARVLRFKLVTTSGSYTLDWSFASTQLQTWTHVAGSYDGTTMLLCVNGAQVLSRAATGTIVDNGGTLRIGKGSDIGGPIEVWNGNIDEARLWPFGRTPAEIAGSMNAELSSLPGLVSTWNLNGNGTDSSSAQNAVASGTVTFGTNTPTLATRLFVGAVAGTGTAGCLGTIQQAVAGTTQSGNAGFGLWAQRVPASAPAVLVFGAQVLQNPIQVLGISIWVDLNGVVTLPTTASSLGALHVPLPVPAGLVGGFASQFVVLDSCGSQGLTSSTCIGTVILP